MIFRGRKTVVVIDALIIAALLMAWACFVFPNEDTYAVSGVVIGQATNGEGGKLRGCKAGDQSGSEVAKASWTYGSKSSSPFHWKYVFRAKDPEIAKQIANNMKAAIDNNHVGYDQNSPDRNTFYDEAKKVDWDIAAVKVDCETTCSSVLSVCLNAAGVKVPRTWYSEIVYDDIMKTEQFDCYTESEYTASPDKLLPGDILCNPDAHTAMVIESPNHFTYEITYNDNDGEEQKDRIEEGTEIMISLNGNDDDIKVKVEKSIDLKEYEPNKEAFTFEGWKKADGNSYIASYKGKIAPIRVSNQYVTIEDAK